MEFSFQNLFNPDKTSEIELQKRRMLAFKDYCGTSDTKFRRLFVVSDGYDQSALSDGYVAFRTKSEQNDQTPSHNTWFNVKEFCLL